MTSEDIKHQLTSYSDCLWVSLNHFSYVVDVTLVSKMAGAVTGNGTRELVIVTKGLKTSVNSAVDQNDSVFRFVERV